MRSLTSLLVRSAGAILLAYAIGSVQAQDHGHLNVGAQAQRQGAPLTFDNGPDFAAASGYIKTLTYTNSGKFSNLFQGNITLTALHSADAFGQPIPTAPAPGAFIVVEIVSVSGPSGGAFQFWETNSVDAPKYSIPAPTSAGSFAFEVSEAALGAGEPGGDPFGHFHGRRFSATLPGVYEVGFRALDTSSNGSGGAPIHTTSETLLVRFQAGVNLISARPVLGQIEISVAAPAGAVWQLESQSRWSGESWTPVGAPFAGADKIVTIEDPRSDTPARFYRVSGVAVSP